MALQADCPVVSGQAPELNSSTTLADFRSIREYYERFGNPVAACLRLDCHQIAQVIAVQRMDDEQGHVAH